MSLVNKIFGKGQGKANSERERLAADQARQFTLPDAQSLSDQAAVRARMAEELAQQRARRESAQPAAAD